MNEIKNQIVVVRGQRVTRTIRDIQEQGHRRVGIVSVDNKFFAVSHEEPKTWHAISEVRWNGKGYTNI